MRESRDMRLLRVHATKLEAEARPDREEWVDEWHSTRVAVERSVLRAAGRLERMLAEHRFLYRRIRKGRARAA